MEKATCCGIAWHGGKEIAIFCLII
jgi:hypothetical protein